MAGHRHSGGLSASATCERRQPRLGSPGSAPRASATSRVVAPRASPIDDQRRVGRAELCEDLQRQLATGVGQRLEDRRECPPGLAAAVSSRRGNVEQACGGKRRGAQQGGWRRGSTRLDRLAHEQGLQGVARAAGWVVAQHRVARVGHDEELGSGNLGSYLAGVGSRSAQIFSAARDQGGDGG